MSAAPVLYDAPGDVLSPSAASQYLGCSFRYYARKILKLPDPPTGALTMGSAVHAATAENFKQKIETKRDLPATGVATIFREAWDLLVKGEFPGKYGKPTLPTEFRDDEDPAELKTQGEALTLLYLDQACPSIEPAAVELPVMGRIGDVIVKGFIDLLDVHGTVIDLKSSSRKPSFNKATDQYEVSNDQKFQVATYAQLCPQATGAGRIDTLVKTKTPALVQQAFTVEQSDVDQTAKMYPLVQRSIRAEHWLPNRSSYLCSRKYCAFWRRCSMEFGGTVQE